MLDSTKPGSEYTRAPSGAFDTRKKMYRAAGIYMAKKYPLLVRELERPYVAPGSTRDEMLCEARKVLRYLSWNRHHAPHKSLPAEINQALFTVACYRQEAVSRERIIDRAFYVTIKDGAKHGLLYGPFTTHRGALENVQQVCNKAHEINSGDAAFAEFGTASLPLANAPEGKLNAYLPKITDPGTVREVCEAPLAPAPVIGSAKRTRRVRQSVSPER